MKITVTAVVAVLAYANTALAHCMICVPGGDRIELINRLDRIPFLIANGAKTAEYQYVRRNTNYNSPVTNVQSTDIRCNIGGLASASSTSVQDVAAGSTVGFALDQAIFHPGPINVYLSKAPGNVQQYDGSGQWFKISQLGATFSTGKMSWPADNIVQYTFKIPAATRKF